MSKAKILKDELQAAEASTHATGSVTANGYVSVYRLPGVAASTLTSDATRVLATRQTGSFAINGTVLYKR